MRQKQKKQLTPTALKMVELLEKQGPMRPKDMAEQLGVSRRTVSKAIKVLLEQGIVQEVPYLMDVRGKVIILKKQLKEQ